MNFKKYLEKSKEFDDFDLTGLRLVPYITELYSTVNEHFKLLLKEKDFNKLLEIATDYYENYSGDYYDGDQNFYYICALFGISVVSWNKVTTEEQDILMNKVIVNKECLADYVDEDIIQDQINEFLQCDVK